MGYGVRCLSCSVFAGRHPNFADGLICLYSLYAFWCININDCEDTLSGNKAIMMHQGTDQQRAAFVARCVLGTIGKAKPNTKQHKYKFDLNKFVLKQYSG